LVGWGLCWRGLALHFGLRNGLVDLVALHLGEVRLWVTLLLGDLFVVLTVLQVVVVLIVPLTLGLVPELVVVLRPFQAVWVLLRLCLLCL